MNPEAQEKLEIIRNKEINSLTPGDIVFLRARRSYLNQEELERFSAVLESGKPVIAYKDLMNKAKEMGHKVKVGLTREELEKMVTEEPVME